MRWVFRLGFATIVLVALAIGAIALVPAEKIAGLVAAEVSARTGRALKIDGPVKPVFFPTLGVRADTISLANAEWSSRATMLSAERLLVGVDLWPLFSGEIRIKEFRIVNPVVLLERNTNGSGNWELAKAPAVEGEAGENATASLPGFTLADGQITGADITYADHRTGLETRISEVDLALSLPEAQGPLKFSGQVAYEGEKLTFRGSIKELAGFLNGGISDLSLAIATGFGEMETTGRAGFAPPSAEMDLSAKITDMGRALALAGQTGEAPLERAGMSGMLTYANDNTVYLRKGRLELDDQTVSFDLDLNLNDRPLLTARLAAEALDLSGFVPGGDSSGEAAAETAGEDSWSEDTLDLSALRLLDADIEFSASAVDLGVANLGPTKLRARLERGRLVIGLTEVNAYDGRLIGEFVVNARSGLSMGGDLTLADVQLQPLLIDLADYDRLSAAASGRLKFLTSGDSVANLMRRLSGSGGFDVGQGELLGLDIAGMLRNLDASYRGDGSKTIFSAITGNFDINDGTLKNDDLLFVSPLVRARGSGDTDLAARTLTYRLVPTALTGQSAGGISVPVLITGRWSDLSFRPDLQGLFDAELEKQRAEAAEKIRADVEQAAREAEEKLRGDVERAVQEGVEKTLGDLLNRITGQE